MISQNCFFVTLVLIVTNTDANRNALCNTPNGETGTCLLITECLNIYKLYLTGNMRDKAYVQQAQCGYEGDTLLVCCGSASNSDEGPRQQNVEKYFVSEDFPDESICGLHAAPFSVDRIYFGNITDIIEFPWMAALEFRDRTTKKPQGVQCGGTIINNKYVLTAAHCLNNIVLEVFQVRLGEWDTAVDPDCEDLDRTSCVDPVQNISVEYVIPHPYYHTRTKNNDIGLIRLAKNITYSDYIRPICLASIDSPPLSSEFKLVVTGWGMTENNNPSRWKLKTDVPLVNNKQCKEAAVAGRFTLGWIGLNQICAGGAEGKDACQGDSGGPLMRSYTNQNNGLVQWYQEGIVSWGMMCGTSNPAVYTNVRKYRNWIYNNLE